MLVNVCDPMRFFAPHGTRLAALTEPERSSAIAETIVKAWPGW